MNIQQATRLYNELHSRTQTPECYFAYNAIRKAIREGYDHVHITMNENHDLNTVGRILECNGYTVIYHAESEHIKARITVFGWVNYGA